MIEPLNNTKGLLLRDVRWKVTTAGPSPYDNERTELFLLGCKRAMDGNPCKGCFNSSAWNNSKAEFSYDPIDMAKHIEEHAPSKYITIGGGEPLDQIDNLILLCKELKKFNFHIIVYTWRDLLRSIDMAPIYTLPNDFNSHYWVGRTKVRKLLKYVDIIIDGEYKEELRLYDETAKDGLASSIGSGNQTIWDIHYNTMTGYKMSDVESIELNNIGRLTVELNENIQPKEIKWR